MTTIFDLCSAAPAAARGQPTQIVHGAGVWRHVVEIADPAAGASVQWYDITAYFCGYDYTRGADQYQGRYRASVATLEVCADDDRLAPWNDDTSALFGTHVELGPGLLLRSGFIRVSGGVVVEWNPRFTCKVESWSDASYSDGKVRRHRIVARDTLSSLVNIPLPAREENNWSEHMFLFLVDSGWPYGSLIYGAQYEADTTTPILTLPARPAASSAVNELDVICDPVGLVWYTNRTGALVVRPRVDDTFHADAFAAGATGDQLPTVAPVDFTWWACIEAPGESPSDVAAYAQDNAIEPFGLDRTERAVINHVKITYPAGGFDDDDPISIQRFDRHTFQASWVAANDTVAAAMLGSRKFATVEARPLHTAVELPGFHPGPANLDYLGYVSIQHRNNDAGLVAYANGWLRHQREQVAPRGCDVDWAITNIVDVYEVSSDEGLLPVEDLAVVDVDVTSAEFSWTNPAQTITPTHTQVRLMNTASLWATTGYPITGLIWSGLTAATGYTFQVRLIRVVDGLITHVSPMRQISFTTDTPTTPPPVVDDGTVTFPDPPCGTLDWELQESTDPATWANPLIPEYAVIDSGTISAPPFTLDLSGYTFNPAKLYRVWQDNCGAESYSNLFVGACSEPAILGTAPYDDDALVAYWPAICPPDIVVESISETAAAHGPSWDGFVLDADDSIVLVANGDGLVAYGPAPAAIATLVDDTTIAARVLLSTQPDAPVVLFSVAGLAIEALADAGNWKVRGKAHEEGAGVTTITPGSIELDFGAWYDVALVHDEAAGDLTLYVDGTLVASALGTVGERHPTSTVELGVSDNGLITNCAVWDRVLDPSELPGYVPLLTVTINQKAGQSDPATGTPILFEAVFSEAVTGFVGTDVTLSGTAGATVAAVSTLDNITFTVAVSGMTGSGTVIATIAAGVCTATATSVMNQASTSTDNTVTYAPFTPWASTLFKYVWSASGPSYVLTSPTAGAAEDFIPDERNTATGSGSSELGMATASRRPIYRSSVSALNNKPAWEFDGVNDIIQNVGAINGTAGNPGTQAVPYTLVVIAVIGSTGSFRYITDSIGVGAARLIIGQGSSATAWRLYAGSDTTGGTASTGAHAFRAKITSSTDNLVVDGTTVITGNAGGSTFDGITLGGAYDGTTNLACHVAFAALGPGDATAHADWSAFVAWVSSFYGLTIG